LLFYNFYISLVITTMFHLLLQFVCSYNNNLFVLITTIMDDRPNKPSKRKLAKSAQPSHEEKKAMTVELEKARLKDDRPSVQPAPLEPHFEPPVGDLGTAAPPYVDNSSHEAAASNIYPEGYDYGGRYGGYQATRFKSSQLDDRECDARAEYNYQVSRRPTSAPGYVGSYSAHFNDPNAYGQGHRASNAASQGESPAPQALNRMQRILESIERAMSASSLHIQLFFGQGELLHYFR
jgi:hypothetical protein